MNRRGLLIFCLLFLLSLAGTRAVGQLYVGLGYQQGFWVMPNAHVPIDRFNASGFLARDYGKWRWPGGEIYSVSYRNEDGLLLELTMNSRRQRISAESFGGSGLTRRDLRFSMQAFSFAAGSAVINDETFVMYLGGSADLGWMRVLNRLGPKATINNVNYSLLLRQNMVAVSAFLKMVWRSAPDALVVVSLTPYVQYPLQQFDFSFVNRVLNPNTWSEDPDPLLGRPINFGLQFNVDMDLLGILGN
ncbi:MAG: hypothetical protein AAGN35_23480 [Bacteroidota bacterium]